MFKHLTLSSRITAAFLLMGVLILLISALAWRVSSQLTDQLMKVGNEAFPTTIALWKINEGHTLVRSAERGLLNPVTSLEERQQDLQRVEKGWKQINEGFQEYQSILHSPEEDKIYQDFLSMWETWKTAHEDFLKLNQVYESYRIINPRQVQLDLLEQGKNRSPLMSKAKEAVKALDKMNAQTVETRSPAARAVSERLRNIIDYTETQKNKLEKEIQSDIRESKFWVVISLLLGPSTAITFAIFFSKTLIQNIKESGSAITSSIFQISASGKQLEATVTEQVASTHEVTATAQEIAKTAIQLRKTMERVSGLVEETDRAAREGQEEISSMEVSMKHLSSATILISNRLGTIRDRANQINSVVTTITKVADRTNLLSLNAAIEAEKAGEYGKGFSVVSREIRRLADQTAISTLEIEDTVKEMQFAVSAGVMEMDKFTNEVNQNVEDIASIGIKLSNIIKQVQTLAPRFEKVNIGMENQTEAAQQISEAMEQLSEASSQTAKAIKGINDAMLGLRTASYELRQQISANYKEPKLKSA